MASPQKEDGFTPIANEILDHLLRMHLSCDQWRILLCIIRSTYGYHKKVNKLANIQIAELTGLHIAVVSRGLKNLEDQKMIVKNGKVLGLQKDWQQWKLAVSLTNEATQPRRKLAVQLINGEKVSSIANKEPSSKLAVSLTNEAKEEKKLAEPLTNVDGKLAEPLTNVAKQSGQKLAVQLTQVSSIANKKLAVSLTLGGGRGGRIKDNKENFKDNSPAKQPGLSRNPFIARMQKALGYPETLKTDPIPNPAKEAMFIKKMQSRGFSYEEIFNAWQEKVRQRHCFVSMVYVNDDIEGHDAKTRLPGFQRQYHEPPA